MYLSRGLQQDMPWVRRQLLAPCLPLSWAQDTATTLTSCKCSWLLWLHSHCTNPRPTNPLVAHSADGLHSHLPLGQPSSDEDSLLAAVVLPAPVLSPWQVRKHLGDIWKGSYRSGVSLVNSFSFTGSCQMPLRNCLDKFFFVFFLFNNRKDWIMPCNAKVSLLSSVNVKYN